MRVFPHMHPRAVRAFARDDAGVAHAVPVEHLWPTPGGGKGGLRLAAQMRADQADIDVAAGDEAFLSRYIGQAADVVGETDDRRCAELLHDEGLLRAARLHACARGHEAGADPMLHRLPHIMAAIDQAVAIDAMHHIVARHAGHQVVARQQAVLHFPAAWAEQQRLRLAGGAAGGVEDDLWPLPGQMRVLPMEVAERREGRDAGHDVGLVVAWQLRQVVQRADVAGLDPLRAPQPLVEGHLPGEGEDALEIAFLPRPQRVA